MISHDFINDIAMACQLSLITTKPQYKCDGFTMVSENGLCVISKDDYVHVSYNNGEYQYSNMAKCTDELKQMIIDAYRSARIEIAKKQEDNRVKQINKFYGV